MSLSTASESQIKDLSAWPLSDLVQHEEDLESALLTNGRRIDNLLAQFQRQYLLLKSERDSIEAQLMATRKIAADKSRVAQLLRFPWELSRVAHLLCPSRQVLESEPGRSSEWGDPSTLLTFGSERLTREAVAYFDALRGARKSVGNPSLLQLRPGSCVPLAAAGLAKPLTAVLLSPYPPLSAADMLQSESAFEKATIGSRLEKVNQPTLLADRAFIPYMGVPSEGKRADRQRALKSRRYCEEEWAAAHPGVVQSEGDGIGTPMKRSALVEFPLMKSKTAGRTLTSVRPHATGELLFVDEAIFTFPERAEDLILTKELEEALGLIQKKSELFTKHPTWDIRLVVGVFAYLAQSSDSTPMSRQMTRSAGQLAGSATALASRRLNEQLELRRKLFSLACPLDDIDPTLLNEWYKLGQLVHSVLPKHYQALDAADGDAASHDSSTVCTLSVDDIVKLLLILRCNSVLNAAASSRGLSTGNGGIPHPTTRSVFWMVSMLNHSCHPNVTLTYIPDLVDQETGKVLVLVQALRPIEVGEQLFISYINPHQPAAAARRALRERYYFECQCPRCSGGSIQVPCRDEEALDWTRAVMSESAPNGALVPRGTGGVWVHFCTDPERWGSVSEGGRPSTFSMDSEKGLALLQDESRWGQSTLMVQWPKQLQRIEEEGIQKELIRALVNEVAVEQERLSRLRTPNPNQSIPLTERMRLLRSRLTALPTNSVCEQDRKGHEPRVNHYCVVLAQMFVARCAEALLKRFLPTAPEDTARSLVDCVVELAISMVGFCAELTVGVGLNLDGEKVKIEHSPLRNLLASNSTTVASCWEQLAVLLTLLADTQVPGTTIDKPLLLAVASECWQLAYGVYQTLNWTGTSKAIRAQLYACQPQRAIEDWEFTAVSKKDSDNCAEYIPPFL